MADVVVDRKTIDEAIRRLAEIIYYASDARANL